MTDPGAVCSFRSQASQLRFSFALCSKVMIAREGLWLSRARAGKHHSSKLLEGLVVLRRVRIRDLFLEPRVGIVYCLDDRQLKFGQIGLRNAD